MRVQREDQFDYDRLLLGDREHGNVVRHDAVQGQDAQLAVGERLREFLNQGGKTGFVGSTDTHEGKPAAKTAVLARELTRPAIFDALRHRRNYAVFNARIVLDFKINGHVMGEEIEIEGNPGSWSR